MVKPKSEKSRISPPPLMRRAGVNSGVVLTDPDRLKRPEDLFGRLPHGTLVIVRDYDDPERAQRQARLARIAAPKGIVVVLSGKGHARDNDLKRRPPARGATLSAAAHSRRALMRAKKRGAALVLVSPLFPTRSHKGAATLGVHRFARLIRGARVQVAALGGVNGRTAAQLKGIPGCTAVAAIDGWVED